ncbi:site-specific integrase, partial [Vibrio parahaemolyticus]|uniref:phage integrase n=1 Tax=Vibrio parahaemolyticus TaxID=670 RepID=UPI0017FFC3CC|nr:site-specific integrase [Vibrio parahaemolyticus]
TGDKPDHRRLAQLIELWFDHYGATLANGPVIKSKFLKMAEAMGNPVASTFSSRVYSEFRSRRMSGELIFVDARWQKGAPSIATLNSELARFKAMFSKLKELGEWKSQNPLEEVKPFKDHERTMAFLQKEQISLLLEQVKGHQRTDRLKIVQRCLSTGARWNEA